MNNLKITAVVVTYNRKETLLDCLKAIENQTVKPTTVCILDNASTDGTAAALLDEGFVNTEREGIHFQYIPNEKNEGGSGGFYKGMKTAIESTSCDAIWVMDDDGLPDKDCLKNLLPHLQYYDYLSPLVIDIKDEDMMAFEGCTVAEFLKREVNGVVKGCANPFNGVLYSKKLIEAVGYPKKEMFIWGDEINYDLRAKASGFQPVMVTNAIHRHPLNRQRYVHYFGKHMMVVPEQDWKLFCYLRNRTYNAKLFSRSITCMKLVFSDFIRFSCYFLMQAHQPSKIFLVAKAQYKGLVKDFSGLDKYMK